MSSIRRFVASALVVFAVAATFGPDAAQGQQGPPPPVLLNVPLVRQQTPVWCWLAVSEMAMQYRNMGASAKQCEIMEIGYGLAPGTCCANPQACARPASGMHEVQNVIARFGGVLTAWTLPQDPATLYRLLQADRPVIAQFRSSAASTHVVVVRGMRFQTVQTGYHPIYGPIYSHVPMVLVNDPLGVFPQEIAYANLAALWVDSLIIGPKAAPPPPPAASSAAPAQSQQPPPSNAFCAALQDVISAAPAFDRIKGKRQEDDDDDEAETWNAKVVLPGMTTCLVTQDAKGDTHSTGYFCSRMTTASDEEDACKDTDDQYRAFRYRVGSCLSGWTRSAGSTNKPTGAKTVGRSATPRPMKVQVRISAMSRKDGEKPRCQVWIDVDND